MCGSLIFRSNQKIFTGLNRYIKSMEDKIP